MEITHYNNKLDLQLAIIRIYIGLDFVHHFAEKFGLLGQQAFDDVSNYFLSVGLSTGFMLFAGICEFAAFVGFTFGLLTRFAAVGTALYLIICLFAGHHDMAGFTWANHASDIMINGTLQTVYGGWEYPLLWAVICLSFVITGGRKWSVDAKIRQATNSKILNFLAK